MADEHSPAPWTARYLPYRGPDGALIVPPRHWPRRILGVLTYSAVTSTLFLIFAIGYGFTLQPWMEIILYRVPLLFTDLPRFLVSLLVAPWLNHHPIQLLYVLLLLSLFGIPLEVREGTRRVALVFYATSITAGIASGLLLHAIRAIAEARWIQTAWEQPWVGGSAGCFGLMGFYAGRARNPWPLLAAFFIWELNVEIWHLKNYTIVFHMIAMITGFAMTRWWPRWRRTDNTAAGS